MMSENKTEQTPKKKNIFKKQLGLIITVAVVAIALLVVYFALIKPMTEDDKPAEGEQNNVELIWDDEIAYTYNRIMVYEHLRPDDIKEIKIHNPANKEKYGEQYVNWGIYRFEGEDPDKLKQDGELYFTDYEYAPYDSVMMSSLTNACGMAIASSRIEDHCTDYSKYGLDYKNDEEATYYEITSMKGATYKVYIGDMLPSGSGYYIRVVGKDNSLEGKGEIERDSVYVSSNGYLGSSVLKSPLEHISAYLAYPIDPSASSTFDYFLFMNHEKDDETVSFIPIKNQKDPFSSFSGMSIYSTVEPAGYYSSGAFEDLLETFQTLQGDRVIELGTPQISEEDKSTYIGFSDEVLKKYKIDECSYTVTFKHADIESTFVVSPLQKDADGDFYYVYSMVMNTIVKVKYETLYFLTWSIETFVSREVYNMKIDNVESITVNGSYNDLGIEFPDRVGVQKVNETFRLDGIVKNLQVTAQSSGNKVNTDNFRQLFRLMLQMYTREELSEDEVKKALENEAFASIQVVTREKTVYKTNDKGVETSEIDYKLPSVTRIYRFYNHSNGRCLVTTESIDEDGKSTGELGSLYMMIGRVEQILSSTITLLEGKSVSGNSRY